MSESDSELKEVNNVDVAIAVEVEGGVVVASERVSELEEVNDVHASIAVDVATVDDNRFDLRASHVDHELIHRVGVQCVSSQVLNSAVATVECQLVSAFGRGDGGQVDGVLAW